MIIRLGNTILNQLKISIGNVLIYARGRFTRVIQPTTPNNAYYLAPDINGDFTKAMVEDAVALGETYIVFDAKTLDVNYSETNGEYLSLDGVKGTELNPITLDFRNVSINCYPDPNNLLKKHKVFVLENCENVIVKFGTVEGDKFKRTFDTYSEIITEGTYLIASAKGTKNLIIDGGNAAGFMGDVAHSIVYGSAHIDTYPEGNAYYLQGDGRYESIFYNVDPTLYETFGLTGGLGFNRLLYYDMEDVTFKFYDTNENFISEITGAQYFVTYTFPVTARKMKVNVRPMDGRQESPTNFGHMLQYNPNSGTNVINLKISDNHRGGVSNIGANAIIRGNEFYKTERYDTVPEFADSTLYHINCEDAVSRNLVIDNNIFKDKFHKILLTHNINANITDNIFIGGANDIFVYDLLYGNVTGNNFTGNVSLGNGTNKGSVIVSNNTGTPDIILTNGAEWTNNNFTGGNISGLGKLNNNTLTNVGFGGITWNKEIYNNIFIGNGGSHYISTNSYIYNNEFRNLEFRFQTFENGSVYFDSVTIDNTLTPNVFGFNRSFDSNTIIAVNSLFKNLRITNGNTAGNWYFENCTFQDISDYIIDLKTTQEDYVSARFYFKNCTFVGSGNFLTKFYNLGLYEITVDNCTIDVNITMPATYTNATVTMPALVEPRTQPIPDLTYNVDRVQVYTDYHIMNLQIRNKNTQEVILNEDVCSTYNHFTATPNDFEYSIDGGVYWDSLSI